MDVLQLFHVDLVWGEHIADFFDFLNYHVQVVSFLEYELIQLDISELFVEVLEKFGRRLQDLICKIHQAVAHDEHLLSWVYLRVSFSLQFAFVRLDGCKCFLSLEVCLCEEESIALNGFYS